MGFKNRILYKEKNKNDKIWIKPVGKGKWKVKWVCFYGIICFLSISYVIPNMKDASTNYNFKNTWIIQPSTKFLSLGPQYRVSFAIWQNAMHQLIYSFTVLACYQLISIFKKSMKNYPYIHEGKVKIFPNGPDWVKLPINKIRNA